MSWLFDRLTDLAVAERLDIVVDAEPINAVAAQLQRAERLALTDVHRGCPSSVADWVEQPHGARFVASGTPQATALFSALGDRDLGVAVAAHAPGAALKVDSVGDLNSLLDALITMRSYAQRIPS